MKRRTIRYAAYGSNLHPFRLKERAPSAELKGTSFLRGWALRFNKRSHDESGKCNIVGPGDGVYVAIYEMTEEDKRRLNIVEGLGNGYSERVIDVPGFGPCMTYDAARSHIDEQLRPYDWYKEIVLLGCRELGLPRGYVANIVAIQAQRDPDPRRRQENRSTIEMLRQSSRQSKSVP